MLFTGDGDFRVLVAMLQELGCRVSVVSTVETKPPMISDDLRRQADQFIDIVDIEESIARQPASRGRTKARQDDDAKTPAESHDDIATLSDDDVL